MYRLIFLLMVLIASVWAGIKISDDPGFLIFGMRDWSVEMPLWAAVVMVLIILLVLHFIHRFFASIGAGWDAWQDWLKTRRKLKAYNNTNRALISLIEANWKNAEYYSLKGIANSDAPFINYLAAAKAAHELKQYQRRDVYLQKARSAAPQSEVAIGIVQAQLQITQGMISQAFNTLTKLQLTSPNHGMVLKLLERVYIHLADWPALIQLIPRLRKAHVMSEEQINLLERHTYEEMLRHPDNRLKKTSGLRELWAAIPTKMQRDPHVLYAYVNHLRNFTECADEAADLIYAALKKNWNADLVRVYGLLITTHPKKQLAHAENWIKHYGDKAILYLTLARLCMQCQLWGKARSNFEESLQLENNPETAVEYGRFLEQLGESTAALRQYRDGLITVVRDAKYKSQ